MSEHISSGTVNLLVGGHLLMALCAVLYLAWWIIFFRPDIPKVAGALYYIGVGCIVVAAIAGIAGAVMIGVGTSNASAAGEAPSGWWFAIGAVIAYFVLGFVTSRLLGRPVTTELLLFVAWTALELACIVTLGSIGGFSVARAAVFATIVAVAFIGMLVTYMLYYSLAPFPSFIDGAIPLAFVGLLSVVLACCIRGM